MKKKYDFGGYATKVDLKCADGRIIRKDAFKHQDGETLPLVWQHLTNTPNNILGHALLENRPDGMYAYCTFNDTDAGKNSKILVHHKDITSLSIHARKLKQRGDDVIHGVIHEVSLVMAGANPGAVIDNLCISHSDGNYETDETEGLIYTGEEFSLEHEDSQTDDDVINHESKDDLTVGDVFETLNEQQRNVVYAIFAKALEENATKHSDTGGDEMKVNVFDNDETNETGGATLSHAQFQTILADANKIGSFREAVLMHATEYGIEDIDVLFPDARTLSKDPEWLKREDDWVQGVLSAIGKSPFSRVKSVITDMDFDEARAKGYVKATEKKEVYFKAAKRVTTPYTIYVKQKLDRDDIIDVTDFDIVAMVRYQLRTLLDEELAVAALLGDGRAVDDQYKINEENIRPIWTDDDLYSVKEVLTTKTDYKAMIKEIALTHKRYKGSGSPVLFTTSDIHTNMLWVEDLTGRRIYESDATLCAALRVSRIVEVPQLEGKNRLVGLTDDVHELLAIKVNLKDYNFGADKGGQIATFDDFDIDFNQYKYLMETRCSGALIKPKSAQVFEFKTEAEPPVG